MWRRGPSGPGRQAPVGAAERVGSERCDGMIGMAASAAGSPGIASTGAAWLSARSQPGARCGSAGTRGSPT